VEGDAEGLLSGASAFPDENILLPLQVSLRERQKKSCLCAPAPLEFSHFFLYFFVAFAPGGGHEHSGATDGADLGTGGRECHGAGAYLG
jgi:hypothetical protein